MTTNTTAYYDATAAEYDTLHGACAELAVTMESSWTLFKSMSPASVLDVGCGTGLCLDWFRHARPMLQLTGVDPSHKLLEIARSRVPSAMFLQGDGERLPLGDNSIDVVVATGIMHHVDSPPRVISEMFRVARKAVFIADHNNFAFGGSLARRARMALHAVGLLRAATFVKQGFRSQGYTEGDGWWYPYSLFESHADISKFSDVKYFIPTRPVNSGHLKNLIFNQSHLAVFAVKRHLPNSST